MLYSARDIDLYGMPDRRTTPPEFEAPDDDRPDYRECDGEGHDDENGDCPLYKCDFCSHEMRHHGKDGCSVERGDGYRLGTLQALGPCSCLGEKE
jgi:hypothetical protein